MVEFSRPGYELRVASYALRVAPLLLRSKRDLRSASTGQDYGLRVASYKLRVMRFSMNKFTP